MYTIFYFTSNFFNPSRYKAGWKGHAANAKVSIIAFPMWQQQVRTCGPCSLPSDRCWGKKETRRCCWHLNICLSLNAADDAVDDAKHQQGKIPTFSPSSAELKITQTSKELLLGKVNLQVFKFYLLFLQVAVPIPIFQGHMYRYKVGACF